ncbi:MAG: multicopper oxidase domain-containing protein [Syntrophobacterales bacterium]
MKKITSLAALLLVIIFAPLLLQAKTVEYDLTIAEKVVNITGKPRSGLTVNGGIPGPVLRFREGDLARIRVHNQMNVDSSVHWHGLLVPPGMDGVPYVSFPPIKPHTTFTYEFPLRQSGTYWYHSHTNLHEQRGVYGSIVIEPRAPEPRQADRDYVVLFSDWTDAKPHEVLRTLKRGSEWFSIQKGSSQSILGAARIGMLGDYVKRELLRMPTMDLSDIAYNYFLANGQPEIWLAAEPGETVRLRLIDGGAASNFNLEYAGGPLTIIASDGQNVEPVKLKGFIMVIAETYDVLVQVPPSGGAYELRATAHDGSGFASVWIGTGERHAAPDMPHPNLYSFKGKITLKKLFALTPQASMGMSDREVKAGKFDQPGMMGMKSMGMKSMEMDKSRGGAGNNMKGMHHPPTHSGRPTAEKEEITTPAGTQENLAAQRRGKRFSYNFRPLATDVSAAKNLAIDGQDPRRPWPPYDKLRATHSTAFPPDKPVREIRLTLDGDMERFVWLINNKPLSASDVIRIRKGEVTRFIMINRTMMHHPMHLHGHFFRVLNDQGDYSPLKHTVNVAPMSTTVIEFEANEVGDWFFHCHILYHLESGMARVVHYESFVMNPQLAAVRPLLYKDPWYAWARVDAMSQMTQGFAILSNTRNILTFTWDDVGWQKVEGVEWETIFTWDRYINRFFTVFAGADLIWENDSLDRSVGVFGLRYLFPLNIESRIWVDTEGDARFDLGKNLQLTPRFALFGEAEYDTNRLWELRGGATYLLSKNFSLITQWHSDFGWGGGVRMRF